MNVQSVLMPFRLFFNRYHHFIFFFAILGFVAFFNLWSYPSRILFLIILYTAGGNLGARYFVLLRSRGETLPPESVEEKMKFFLARVFPFLYFSFIVGVWRFNLWSYLDYTFTLLILYILGSVALQLIIGPVWRKDKYQKIHTRAKEGDSQWALVTS